MEDIIWIRIAQILPGNYPEWVRQAWLGCILPSEGGSIEAFARAQGVGPKPRLSLVTEIPKTDTEPVPKIDGFIVRRDKALTILHKKLPAAALWYRENNYLQPHSYFAFGASEVEVIEPDVPAAQPMQ